MRNLFLSYDTVEAFAVKRNPVLSFPYLKENGELLGISVDSGFLIEPRALRLYDDFYKNALKFTELYPQYYRFTFGMVIDLEKGGMQGNQSQIIAKYVEDQNFLSFDTADPRKLETLTMLSEVGSLSPDSLEIYDNIIKRVDSFISQPNWYKKFNKPLFYDLTHIIFFLTRNGTQALPLRNDARTCLQYMGLLSLLDDDADLLAEVCVCLSYIGADIPDYWDEFLQKSLEEINITYDGTVASAINPSVDEYHIYFVLNWYQAMRNRDAFKTRFTGRIPSFSILNQQESILSKLSSYLHQSHFNIKPNKATLEVFLSHLEEQELDHWFACINSTHHSHEIIDSFFRAKAHIP